MRLSCLVVDCSVSRFGLGAHISCSIACAKYDDVAACLFRYVTENSISCGKKTQLSVIQLDKNSWIQIAGFLFFFKNLI